MPKTLWAAMMAVLTLGAATPELTADKWLQAPSGFDGRLSALHGKVVVLEFWATWCAPCVGAIPHMNKLAEEFRGQDVVFLAVTDDDAERLQPFLEKRPMDAAIAIDRSRKNWKTWDVPSIPHTVVIGKGGAIVGATDPEHVTSAVLRDVLNGGSPVLPPKEGVPSDLDWDRNQVVWQDGIVPEMYCIIKPIKTTTSGTKTGKNRFIADGVPLSMLIQSAWQPGQFRTDLRLPDTGKFYRAAVQVPENRKEQLWPYLRATLTAMFGFQARWEGQERDVFILRRVEGREPPAESQADQEIRMQLRGKITLHKQPVKELCDMLTNALNKPVLDETALAGRYDFDLPYQPGQTEVILGALKDKGLEVTKEKRRIPILVVESEAR